MPKDVAWLMIYSNIIGMQFHPGYDTWRCGTDVSFADCAKLADSAYKEYLCRFSEQQPLG